MGERDDDDATGAAGTAAGVIVAVASEDVFAVVDSLSEGDNRTGAVPAARRRGRHSSGGSLGGAERSFEEEEEEGSVASVSGRRRPSAHSLRPANADGERIDREGIDHGATRAAKNNSGAAIASIRYEGIDEEDDLDAKVDEEDIVDDGDDDKDSMSVYSRGWKYSSLEESSFQSSSSGGGGGSDADDDLLGKVEGHIPCSFVLGAAAAGMGGEGIGSGAVPALLFIRINRPKTGVRSVLQCTYTYT
mmetsp:Transcript_43928/g.81697  ORF Transcript_43928/g.81697 Transcript_43928/m.81697 type:complete len:247 (-) Transcript_43928:162-902(-)